jgi:hypothetical protein
VVEGVVGGVGEVGLRRERGGGFLREVDDTNCAGFYDAAGGGGVVAGDDLEEGRFADAVGADEGYTLAGVYGEANAFEDGVDII